VTLIWQDLGRNGVPLEENFSAEKENSFSATTFYRCDSKKLAGNYRLLGHNEGAALDAKGGVISNTFQGNPLHTVGRNTVVVISHADCRMILRILHRQAPRGVRYLIRP